MRTYKKIPNWYKKGDVLQGNLSLAGCTGLTSLPEGLNVGGYISLAGCTGLTK